ncbi:MAG TPA: winged helix-turn-helix domain-containing protein [Candidatus Baltobacteraceae bacterium]|nr:winged helix-turn-helix domain-containing protein [Candidatus Baltobacteraceae bacterium]
MKQQGTTKEDIITLISKGDNTLSAICRRLGLAPSTVSKHLHDLEASGAIRQKETHFKRWKHYDLAPNVNAAVQGRGITVSRALTISAVAIAVLVAAYSLSLAHYSTPGQGTSYAYMPVSITDPPIVPQGAQALYINYSSLNVYVNYKGGSEWLDLNSSGRLDLMSLTNSSQVIGLAGIRLNSTVDSVRFNITSASITIGNVTYGVYVPGGQVRTAVENSNVVNASSDLLIDFSPTVTAIGAQNATTFIMVPSLRAGVFSDPAMVRQVNSKSRVQLNFPLTKPNSKLFPDAGLNATASAKMLISGNYLLFNATVRNSGADNITIISMLVESSAAQAAGGFAIPTSTYARGAVQSNDHMAWYNSSLNDSEHRFYSFGNGSVAINASALYSAWVNSGRDSVNITLQKPTNRIMISGLGTPLGIGSLNRAYTGSQPGGLNFILDSNGMLTPLSIRQGSLPGRIGYELKPDSAETFVYGGTPDVGADMPTGQSGYRLIVFTNRGLLQANIST